MTANDMNIIRKYCNTIIGEQGCNAYILFLDSKKFNKAVEKCIDEIRYEGLKRQLISNPGAFQSTYYVDNTPDVKTVQEFLKKEMLNQLHERGLITKDEVKKLWPTK